MPNPDTSTATLLAQLINDIEGLTADFASDAELRRDAARLRAVADE